MDLSHYDWVEIRDHATVMITPGAHITISSVMIYDKAHIVAQGTVEQPITIVYSPHVLSPGSDCMYYRGSIYFDTAAGAPASTFSHVIFDGARDSVTHLRLCIAAPYSHNMKRLEGMTSPLSPLPINEYRDLTYKGSFLLHRGHVAIDRSVFRNGIFANIEVRLYTHNNASSLRIANTDFYNTANHIAIVSRVEGKDSLTHVIPQCMKNCTGMDTDKIQIADNADFLRCRSFCWGEVSGDAELLSSNRVQLVNNWYGHADGPERIHGEWRNTGEFVLGDVILDGWRSGPNTQRGSNVLFLPGIKASRLYGDNAEGKSVKVWEPSNRFETDWLQFRKDGTPQMDDGIYTKDVIDEIGIPIIGSNIYKSLIGDIKKMKEHNSITDYLLYAYDWRYGLNDILFNGTRYPDGERKKLVVETERLAATSHSGKVTVIGHSNGGLLAKALVRELEIQGKGHLVDNVVLVGSPQMGTPKSILSFLYGYDEKLSIPWLMDGAKARVLINTMPGAYGLLPSAEYFQRAQDAVIRFRTNAEPYKKYADAYGSRIDDYDTFVQFMTGERDHRVKPDRDAVHAENVINKNLLKRADILHRAIDAWMPSGDIAVIQIAGWGLDTIQGVHYREGNHKDCQKTVDTFDIEGVDCARENQPFYEPRYTVDGDDVVVTPSALMMKGARNVKRYWVDLFNQDTSVTKQNKHSDILEVRQVRNFIKEIIVNRYPPQDLPQYISDKRPSESDKMKNPQRIRMALYSPLHVHLYDQDGNHTGPTTIMQDGKKNKVIETAIPNSYYDVFDGRTYVGWGADSDVRVELDGYGAGVYTVELQEIAVTGTGEKTVGHATFADLPTSDLTTVRFSVPHGDLSDMTSLTADYDGDGTDDYTLAPRLNGVARLTGTEDVPQIVEEDAADAQPTQQQQKKQKKAPTKASIDRWTASRRMTSSTKCPEKIDVTLFGKHFDKDAIVRIGGTKAKNVTHYNSKKTTATFCVTDLRAIKTNPLRSITVQNPSTKADKAAKKIDVAFFY